MRIGVFGTGSVGRTLGGRFIELGHEVRLGSRTADNEAATAWANDAGETASHGTFADAAAFGELLVNATSGGASVEAIGSADASDLDGKVMLDIANPLDFSNGFPPTLSIKDSDSLAETIQRAFPQMRVVKSLNTMNADVMVRPSQLEGGHDVFVSGDDAGAKATVVSLLGEIGWPADAIIDLGDLSTARGPEMFLPLWLRLMAARGSAAFNIKVVG
ncbi:MAG TPA: NAD(P)-binding domain-containing protein [Actinomycetota bacterium]|nr:NAD(P)-binding domain-containing protein [Actinomycetota bacterium]